MLISFVFVLMLFLKLRADPYDSPNVKTVLFHDYDLVKHCWNHDDINLLAVRRIMQDLIPKRIPRNIPVLLKYLQMCINITENLATDKKMQDLARMALYDVLGGYLQSIVIPIANEAYYAGNVDYQTVAELHFMLDDFKYSLATDGGAWSRECDMSRIPTKVAPLDLVMSNPEGACNALFLQPVVENSDNVKYSKVSRIALPYFDNNAKPNAIAVPFRTRNLLSLTNPSSIYILIRYYYIVMRCISTECPEDIIQFNHLYHQWLTSKVVPHLHDVEKWYPGFGGVMRIMETMNQRGLSSQHAVMFAYQGQRSNMVEQEQQHEDIKISELEGSISGKEGIKIMCLTILDKFNIFHLPKTLFYIILFILLLLVLLLFLFCFCSCCMVIYGKLYHSYDKKDAAKRAGPYNGILSLYCGIKDSPTSQKHNENNQKATNVGKTVVSKNMSSSDTSSTIVSPYNYPDTYRDKVSQLNIKPLPYSSMNFNESDTEVEDEESESTY